VIPRVATLAIVEEECKGAATWAERHSVPLSWLPETLQLRATLRQPQTDESFYLIGVFQDYRAMAPAWWFTDEKWTSPPEARLFPKPTPTPFGSSIFLLHSHGPVICIPFNRLAYASHQGPHSDWNAPDNWLNAGRQHAQADYIGDMLGVIHRDFVHTRGRMA